MDSLENEQFASKSCGIGLKGLRQTPGAIVFSATCRACRIPRFSRFRMRANRRIGFDLEGIAVSSGSACSSGKVQPSHVLKPWDSAQNRPGSRALSLGWVHVPADIDRCLEACESSPVLT